MKSKKSQTPILLATLILFAIPLVTPQQNYNSLVYMKCANQTQTTFSTQDSLSSLFQQLLPQSSHSEFFKATAASSSGDGISGLYQCRGSLPSQQDCHNCISTIPQHLACDQAAAAQIELNGCYLEYQTDEFVEESSGRHELVHEICGEEKGDAVGFVEARDAALMGLQEGLESEKGYYQMDYGHVHVIGECQRDLVGCDCSECLGVAAEIAQRDCGSSLWGKVYLDNCFLSYALNLYPEESVKKGEAGKKVAIVLGAAAALGGGFIVLTCIKSKCSAKDDD